MRIWVVAEVVAQERGHDPDRPEGRDESESQRNAGKVRRDACERRQRGPDESRRPLANCCVRDEESEHGAACRRDQAHLDREPVLVEVRLVQRLADVMERGPAVRALERAHHDLAGGDEQEREGVGEERERPEPREPEPPPAGHGVRPESACSFSLCGQPQIVGHSAAIFAFAAVCCAAVANLTFA